MDLALNEARQAAARGEIPVGAVVTDAAGRVLAAAGNRTEAARNPVLHAELVALQEAAAARGDKFLADCTLTVTLEPCAMCAGAIAAFRIKKLVFGAYDPKSGQVLTGTFMDYGMPRADDMCSFDTEEKPYCKWDGSKSSLPSMRKRIALQVRKMKMRNSYSCK